MLERRLVDRGTNSAEDIARRLGKAEYEMGFAPEFDVRVVNDRLDESVAAVEKTITDFISA